MPTDSPSTSRRRGLAPGTGVLIELVRLTVVALGTAIAFQAGAGIADGDIIEASTMRLGIVTLGAGLGYVLGGVLGRAAIGRIDAAERRLREVSAGELLAAAIGAFAGVVIALALVWPVLLLERLLYTLPAAALFVVLLGATGMRIGAARGGELMRFVGVAGRYEVSTPSQGSRTKLVDTSVLIDGRIVDVCRTGFCEGTLVVPRFVLYELQGLADSGDEERRRRGRRGLDILGSLQRASGVALEVADDEAVAEVNDVDAKLVALASRRRIALLTVDANLARVAEVQGVRVLNLNALAEQLRPPVLPGDTLTVQVLKAGKEDGQGVGYLSDGTMVVIESARDRIGASVAVEVTSILSNPNGRMVFGTALPAPTPVDGRRLANG